MISPCGEGPEPGKEGSWVKALGANNFPLSIAGTLDHRDGIVSTCCDAYNSLTLSPGPGPLETEEIMVCNILFDK